jgi:hypothetical protein
MNASTQESQKMAAAVSAVFSYIRAQEDAAALNVSTPVAAQPLVVPAQAAAPALWGISGRQEMMSMRNLMQLRTFQGSKLR